LLLPSLVAAALSAALAAVTLIHPAAADEERVWGPVPAPWLDGLAVLRDHDGDAAAALRELALAEAELARSLAGAPPPLLRARLHAAILAGDLVDAEASVEKLAVRDDAEDLRAFVTGLAAFARGELAAQQAQQPGSDPFAWDRAIRQATAAAVAFQAASLAHAGADWPLARRNAERAAAARSELQRQREQAERDRQRQPDPKPDETRPDEIVPIEQELRRPDDPGLLSAAELQAMLERLRQAEEEKRGVRRAAISARSAGVEQDW
jgi:hypothetical protein